MASTRRGILAFAALAASLGGAGVVWGAPKLGGLPTVLPKVTPAPAAGTPPSGNDILAIVRGSSVLRQGVGTAASSMGLDATKLLSGKGSSPRPAVKMPAAYVSPPCDWDAGIWLTFAQPYAAPSFPSNQWVLMVASGAQTFNPASLSTRTAEAIAQALPMSGSVWMETTPGHGAVFVQMRPPLAGLYVVALSLAHTYPAGAFEVVADRTGAIVAQEIDGNKVIAIVRVAPELLATPPSISLSVGFGTTGTLAWMFNGVSVKRLGY